MSTSEIYNIVEDRVRDINEDIGTLYRRVLMLTFALSLMTAAMILVVIGLIIK